MSGLKSVENPTKNDAYKSSGEDYIVMKVDGKMTDVKMIFHAIPEKTGGSCALFEVLFAPNDASPHHIHHLEDEGFYVIEGELTLHGAHGEIVLGPGEFGWGPRGERHGYSAGPDGARALCFQVPGSPLHNWFRIMAAAEHNPFVEEGGEAKWAKWSYENFRVTQLPMSEFPPGVTTLEEERAVTSVG